MESMNVLTIWRSGSVPDYSENIGTITIEVLGLFKK